ncbi:O-linked N-acetylglucosamine transferase, SPINDLY family protein [Altericista sp. CCNU0014]|uniref:O-linked N-acetylglucosamine transferase, SPINDLY family protein n=1 Tax=Altericista sp. CCNU0014 TaxID=3082949 RepID=UPI00384B2824
MLNSKLYKSATDLFSQGSYSESIVAFEELIHVYPDELVSYWYIGLAYLFLDDETTAQLVWLGAIAEHNNQDTEAIIQSLIKTLSKEAEHLSTIQLYSKSLLIRKYIDFFDSCNIENKLLIIDLHIRLNSFSPNMLDEIELIELLRDEAIFVKKYLIASVLKSVLNQQIDDRSVNFFEACLFRSDSRKECFETIKVAAIKYAFENKLFNAAILLCNLCLKYEPYDLVVLGYLPHFYTAVNQHKEAIEAAKFFWLQSIKLEDRFLSCCIFLQTLMKAGDWDEVPIVSEQLRVLMLEIIENGSTQLSLNVLQFLIVNTGLFAYLKDDLAENRKLQNEAAELFFNNIITNAKSQIKTLPFSRVDAGRPLRVGYISSKFSRHSVAWLARWLFQYHDQVEFEITAYVVEQSPDNDFFKAWFSPYVGCIRHLIGDIGISADIIRNDRLDILVDLDSFTVDQTCLILSLKPAPIQVTWLGCDASGLPAIDYFIADPYVLPSNAQTYYKERIWRLPQTYVAVDGFEVGTPSLRRLDLDIPNHAVIYLSSQVGSKRNPMAVRLQMKILKEVSESYFLVKGLGDQNLICNFFSQIASEEGVSADRLRFLPFAENEYIHRANLQIADIVLDTYPYNGATTTLETLWMAIPLVTRVGEQFAARNSYAFMQNAGIEEGIAWTDEEYVEWGIRFGQDEQLRQRVAWKLKQSRKTSPLWNAKQFARDMENAYRSMWALYLEQQ